MESYAQHWPDHLMPACWAFDLTKCRASWSGSRDHKSKTVVGTNAGLGPMIMIIV